MTSQAQERAEERIAEAVRDGRTSVNLRGLGLTELPASLLGRTGPGAGPGRPGLTTVDLACNRLTALPDAVDAMAGVTDLDLSANRLEALPDAIGGLTGLTRLNLHGNRVLETLPSSVADLTDLADLDLGNNAFTALPPWLGALPRLTRLTAGSNPLTALPEELAELTRLEHLDLAFDTLGALPDWIARLTTLTNLHLTGCGLTALPEWIGDLTALDSLGLDMNGIAELPDTIGGLTALTGLWLEENHLTALPDTICGLNRLEYLALRNNRLTALPDGIGDLTELGHLTLDHNALTTLPASIGRLRQLKTLYLTGNRLTALPASIGGLTALTTLPASANALTELPDGIGDLTGLTDLQLSGNRLTRLPERIGDLTALTKLGLGANRLTSLPESLGRLTALTELNLSGNRLTALPASIGALTGLTTLDVYGNDLTDAPPTITPEATARVSGDPSRYRYARTPRTGPGEPAGPGGRHRIELALRSITGITGGPIPQDALDTVDGLSLEPHGATDFGPLSGLRRLRWLSVTSTEPFDLTALVDAVDGAEELTDLSVTAPITDVAPLTRLGRLRMLRLEGTRVVDVSPLADLTHLHDLSITSGPLVDVTPLAGLPLSRLFVYDTQVTDIAPLAGMPLLQVLGLCGCPIRDLTATATMPVLHFVNINRCEAAQVADLAARLPHVTFERRDETSGPSSKPSGASAAGIDADALLARFRNSTDFHERWDMQGALLATRDPDAVQEAIRLPEHTAHTVRGLFFRDGAGNRPFAANPWGIEPDAGWSAALDRVWAPVADHAPHLIAAVRDRTLALALLNDPDGRAALAYVAWRPDDADAADPREPITFEQLADPGHDSHPQIVLGAAPRTVDPATVLPVLAGPVPRPVREFWSVHESLGRLHPRFAHNMLDFFDGRLDEATDRLRGLPPDRFVADAGRNDFLAYLFDLDVLDDAGYPAVACWAFKDGDDVGGHKSFWDWADGSGVELAFY